MATWAQNEMATLSTTGKRLFVQRLWMGFCLVMSSTFSADAMSIGRGGYSGKYLSVYVYSIWFFSCPSSSLPTSGLHKVWYPGIRDRSTWGKFGAHGEHGDVFLFSNLGALWFSENLIRYSLHVCLREVKNNLFSFKHSYLRHFSWRV